MQWDVHNHLQTLVQRDQLMQSLDQTYKQTNKQTNLRFLKFLATLVAPPMSFINVADFRSAKELANYLLYLDSHDGMVQ